MRVVLQRIDGGSVDVDGTRIATLEGPGLLLLVASAAVDDEDPEPVSRLASKIANLRVFADERGIAQHSVLDVGGAALVVSQFTLYGDVRKGRRPSWDRAAKPEEAEPRVEAFAAALEAAGVPVRRGAFGADMRVAFTNDGPYTLILDTEDLARARTARPGTAAGAV